MQRVSTKTGRRRSNCVARSNTLRPSKAWRALAHHHEVKRLRLQASNAGFIGRAGENFESLAFQDQAKDPQVACFLIDEKDFVKSSCKIDSSVV